MLVFDKGLVLMYIIFLYRRVFFSRWVLFKKLVVWIYFIVLI